MRDALLTAGEAAVICAVASATIRKWVERGDLVPFTVDKRGRSLFLRSEVYRLKRQKTAQGP